MGGSSTSQGTMIITRRCGIVIVLLLGSLLSPVLPNLVAASPPQSHSAILIQNNSDFTAANGVTAGTGTPVDPYIIDGWDINASSSSNGITIAGTTAYLVVRNVVVHSGLRGIVFLSVSHVTLQSAVVWGNNGTGVLVENSSDIGLTSNNVTKNGCCAGVRCCLSYSPGILLDRSSNINVSSNSVTLNSGDGVFLNFTHYVRMTGNTISRNNPPGQLGCGGSYDTSSCLGILVYGGNDTTITGNIIELNLSNGLAVYPSFNLTITGNSFTSNAITLMLDSDQEFESLTISADNKIDGKPIYYYKDCKGLNLDGPPLGQLIIFNCDGVRLANLALGDTAGVLLWRVHGSLIIHDTFFSGRAAIQLQGCNVISVIANNFTNSPGLLLSNVNNITIASNVFNGGGISNYPFYESTHDGLVYHNNFINVPSCCSLGNAIGWSWDHGYPSGGNYYSDYSGTDNCSGPSQNICPNPDGIWDRPNPNSMLDHYPLARPFSAASDIAAPTWQSNSTLTASNIGTDSVTLNWSAAQDDVEVIAYRIDLGTTTMSYVPARYHSYKLTSLSAGTVYTFKVAAGDASNYWSTNELSTTVTTAGQQPGNGVTTSLLELVALIAGLGILGSVIGLLGWKRYGRKRLNQRSGRESLAPPSSIAHGVGALFERPALQLPTDFGDLTGTMPEGQATSIGRHSRIWPVVEHAPGLQNAFRMASDPFRTIRH